MIRFVYLTCNHCSVVFQKGKKRYKADRKRNNGVFYCSIQCVGKSQRIEKIRCLECGRKVKESRNSRKFCSLSCSAKFNNRQRPAKSKPKKAKRRGRDYSKTTKGALFREYSTPEAHAKIRGLSRTVYKRAGRPLECKSCGWDHHVDICHVKPVCTFPDDAVITDINSPDNLVALCPNCHWLFDNTELLSGVF